MQNECSKGNDNYYFLCRKKASEHNDALSSRLGAASRLNISESALRNYEVDTANVPQDIVCAMADLYGMPEMETHYCKSDCPIGKHVGSALTCEVKSIESVAVNFLTHTNGNDVQTMQNAVLKIALDGKVNIVDVCVWSLYDNSDVMFDYDSMDNHLREVLKEYDIDPDDYEEEEENGKY